MARPVAMASSATESNYITKYSPTLDIRTMFSISLSSVYTVTTVSDSLTKTWK